jgi:hypothetical protein
LRAPPCPHRAPQLKAGEPRASAGVAVALAARGQPLEARVFGLSVLGHLIKARWAEFAPDDRTTLARLALDRLREGALRACRRAARGALASAQLARRVRAPQAALVP